MATAKPCNVPVRSVRRLTSQRKPAPNFCSAAPPWRKALVYFSVVLISRGHCQSRAKLCACNLDASGVICRLAKVVCSRLRKRARSPTVKERPVTSEISLRILFVQSGLPPLTPNFGQVSEEFSWFSGVGGPPRKFSRNLGSSDRPDAEPTNPTPCVLCAFVCSCVWFVGAPPPSPVEWALS